MSNALSQLSGRMGFNAPDYSADISALGEEEESARASLMKNLLASQAEPKTSTSQALAQGLMTLVPALIGMAIAKKQGGALGAEVGLQAGGNYGQLVEKRNKADQASYKAQALIDQDTLETTRKKKDALEGEQRKTSFDAAKANFTQGKIDDRAAKYGNRSTNITINQPGQPVNLTPKARDELRENVLMAGSGQEILDYVKEKAPSLLKESYKNEKGEYDAGKIADVYGSRLAEFFAGGETERGEFLQRLNSFISEYQKLLSGLASTDKEFDRIYGQIVRSGVVIPQTVPKTLDMIQYLQKKARNRALATLDADVVSRGATPESINAAFDKVAPGLDQQDLTQDSEYQALLQEERAKRGLK